MDYDINSGGKRPLIEAIYKAGDVVTFLLCKEKDTEPVEMEGVVVTVDRYGYFFDESQPYYDIETPGVLYKHIPQSSIIKTVK